MTQDESLHIAAQYLATAAKSFLPHEEDDSHTNLGWNAKFKRLETWSLNKEGVILALNHEDFALDFIHPESGVGASYPLAGAAHFDICKWISREAKFNGIDKDYVYDLHYEIPNGALIKDDFVFPMKDEERLKQIVQLRWLGNMAIETLRSQFIELTNVRVWPHHFDTGSIGYFDASKNVSVGVGLAQPDVNVSDWYFYVSGYHGHDPIKTDPFDPLKRGEWRSGTWNAAVLTATGQSMPTVSAFFKEAVAAF